MTDFKEMYFRLFHGTEQAINMLIETQRNCEELYISPSRPELTVFPLPLGNKKGADEE